MDFLIYCRAITHAPESVDMGSLNEAHWSYMDAFNSRMSVRGPTLSDDRQTWTGSLHVVDLPNAETAQAFALNDPYHVAGLFAGHVIWRFENLLGRTMWDYPGAEGEKPFLILATFGNDHPFEESWNLSPTSDLASRLIVWGRMRPAIAPGNSGMALVLSAPGPDVVRRLIEAEPALFGGCAHLEIHAWEFGGRR